MNATTGSDPILATRALRMAVSAAGRAPSIHNTQPWRWHVPRMAGLARRIAAVLGPHNEVEEHDRVGTSLPVAGDGQ